MTQNENLGAAGFQDENAAAKSQNAEEPEVEEVDVTEVDTDGDELTVEDILAQKPAEAAADNEAAEDDPVALLAARVAQLEDEVARSRAETYNVRQDYSRYVKRAKSEAATTRKEGQEAAVEALLPVLDDIEAARAAGDLTEGPFASIAEKLEETLETRFALERFGAEGDEFDPNLHDALMASANPEVEVPTVKQVLQSGMKIGDRVVRPTKVIVDTPE